MAKRQSPQLIENLRNASRTLRRARKMAKTAADIEAVLANVLPPITLEVIEAIEDGSLQEMASEANLMLTTVDDADAGIVLEWWHYEGLQYVKVWRLVVLQYLTYRHRPDDKRLRQVWQSMFDSHGLHRQDPRPSSYLNSLAENVAECMESLAVYCESKSGGETDTRQWSKLTTKTAIAKLFGVSRDKVYDWITTRELVIDDSPKGYKVRYDLNSPICGKK